MARKYLINGVLIVSVCLAATDAWARSEADKGLNQKQYGAQFQLHDVRSRYWNDVRACLRNWGDHPFANARELRFRVIDADVKLFGLGDNISDTVQTRYPQLIYIRPQVSVMSKATYELLNNNGWYCFKAKINVMSKTVIKAACDAHIVTTKGKATVLGRGESERKGTTVLGKSVIERDCEEEDVETEKDAKADPEADAKTEPKSR